MRQNNNKNSNNRSRGRGGRKGPNPLTRSYESNGPDVKVRGTAQHIAEKYMALARDALASGDGVAAESYFQHAEHYNRIIMSAMAQQNATREDERRFAVPEQMERSGEDEQSEIALAKAEDPQPLIAETGGADEELAPQGQDRGSASDNGGTAGDEQPKPRRKRMPVRQRRAVADAQADRQAEKAGVSDSIADNPPAFLMTD